MTQASLSPDLRGALGAPPAPNGAPARQSVPSEGALWMIALTSSSLIVAAVLLLALLLNNVVRDPSLGGFVSGMGIVIAALGIGGVTYSLVTARRAGYLVDPASAAAGGSVTPSGMHVVPALPPDLGRRKRSQREAERSARNRQAKAIAAATAVAPPKPRPVASPRPGSRPTTPPPAPTRVARPNPAPTARPRPAPTAPVAQARPAPPPAAPAPAKLVVPSGPHPKPPPPTNRPITMPSPRVKQARPAAWPARRPAVRMAAPPMRPRTQAAAFQVNAANVRAAAPIRPH